MPFCLELTRQAVCMHVNSYGDLCPGVRGLRRFAKLQLVKFCPIDQQTSAEAGLTYATFQSDDAILVATGTKEPVGHPL
jgi:hypothetical protein